MRLPPLATPGASLAVRRAEVDFGPLLAGGPVSLLESADPDEMLQLALSEEAEAKKVDVYGCTLWPSSFVAARAMLRLLRPADAVTELGCGPGLPSLAALAAGARLVTATDHSPLALALVERAAHDYQPRRASRLATALLDVTAPRALPLAWPCDVLVAADLLYDVATAAALGERVARQVASRGSTAIVTEPGRMRGAGRAAFLRGVRAAGALPSTRAAALSFVEEAVPPRWCRGAEEACPSVGVCVIEPER